jgi:hypothetical protein
MRKTTVYLPDDIKENLARLAAETGRSEAELIRQALIMLIASAPRPRPNGRLSTAAPGGYWRPSMRFWPALATVSGIVCDTLLPAR